MAWPRFVRHITKDSFFLIHDCTLDFVLSKWSDNPYVYTVWSTICSLYTVSMVIYSALKSQYGLKIIIWLTYWAFYTVALRFIITACNGWFYIIRQKKCNSTNSRFYSLEVEASGSITPVVVDDRTGLALALSSDPAENLTEKGPDSAGIGKQSENSGINISTTASGQEQSNLYILPVMIRLQWFLQNISNHASFLVTALFWIIVYTGDPQDYTSINSHVINSLLVTGDIMISRAPIRIQHFHMPLTYLSIYIGFTLVYWSVGGTNHKCELFIYSVLDYSNHPSRAALAICLIALVGILLLQCYLYLLFRLRNALSRCCIYCSQHVEETGCLFIV